ncbi:MAG: hypothetical protein NTZ03_07775 [Actinobacteria bacterium]|nr:hypothetical protein [Actinomycetota bacterium]
MSGAEVNGPVMLAVGYGLAVVLYGGYWIYLKQKASRLETTLRKVKGSGN